MSDLSRGRRRPRRRTTGIARRARATISELRMTGANPFKEIYC